MPSTQQTEQPKFIEHLAEIARIFLTIGTVGFGGLSAQIEMMETEVVERRKWLERQTFLDFIAVSNLVPGPSVVEIALQIGLNRASWSGFIVAGICLILPSTLMTIACGWAYINFGQLPAVVAAEQGVQPAILAITILSVIKLGRNLIKTWQLGAIAVAGIIVSLVGLNAILVVLGGGIVGMFWLRYLGGFKAPTSSLVPTSKSWFLKIVWGLILTLIVILSIDIAAGTKISLVPVGLFFLKIGTVMYGGGFVLIAFLQEGLVERLHWLSLSQLLDAIAIGQITPGPLLSTVTFIGYILLGVPGAIISTFAVFLPAFIFGAILSSIIAPLRGKIWTSAFLDAINIMGLSLMVTIAIKLGVSILNNWQSLFIWIACLLCTSRWQINPGLLIIGSAIAGFSLNLLASSTIK